MGMSWSSLTSLERKGFLPHDAGEAFSSLYDVERVLFIGDIHLPYHDELVLEQLFLFLAVEKFDRVVVNGDLLDYYMISRFLKKDGGNPTWEYMGVTGVATIGIITSILRLLRAILRRIDTV